MHLLVVDKFGSYAFIADNASCVKGKPDIWKEMQVLNFQW